MNIDTVVCFVDLSSVSRSAARLARAIAEDSSAKLSIVHATNAPIMVTAVGGEFAYVPPRITATLNKHRNRAAQAQLDEIVAAVGDAAIHVESDLVVGRAVEHLLDYADDRGADLIVVGAEEPGFFHKLLHISEPEKLARRAHCPVLVVATETEVRPPLRHLLVATDFSDQARAAARLASSVVGPDGTLSFVHVWEQPDAFKTRKPSPSPDPATQSPLELSQAAQAERLREFVAGIPLETGNVDIYLEVGDPVTRLADRAERVDADAVVVGSHPHNDWGERLFGTVADRIVERIDRPVLTVPADSPGTQLA